MFVCGGVVAMPVQSAVIKFTGHVRKGWGRVVGAISVLYAEAQFGLIIAKH